MNTIIERIDLNPSVVRMIIEAHDIAHAARPGQFVAVMAQETGERIPLTIADSDSAAGTITLIFQKVGRTTERLAALRAGDSVAHILGPLGHPTPVDLVGTVVCVGGGVGVAEMYPVARAFKNAGNRVLCIIGARTKALLILEDLLRAVCDTISVTTDDGSAGRKGFVTEALKETLTQNLPNLVYCIGPVLMMKAVSNLTQPYGIKTVVSLNPVMVDATGMCGSCRCKVAGKTVFGCVDGPDFDGHQVDFDALLKRLDMYKEQEKL
jgi:ferredoxin--NADP+ reductase